MNEQADELTVFLLARITEDEEGAKVGGVSPPRHWSSPTRVLAECGAKRRIAEEHTPRGADALLARPGETVEELRARWALHVQQDAPTACPVCVLIGDVRPCPTLRFLALPYADHADYRQEWTP